MNTFLIKYSIGTLMLVIGFVHVINVFQGVRKWKGEDFEMHSAIHCAHCDFWYSTSGSLMSSKSGEFYAKIFQYEVNPSEKNVLNLKEGQNHPYERPFLKFT